MDYFSQKNVVWGCDVILDYNAPRYISIDSVDSDFFEIFQNHRFDVCINCSGAANVPFSLEKPFNDFKLNTLNVFKLLEAIRLYTPECKFITMSSAAVYGNPTSLPINENMNCNPVSPYGCHKMITERICEEYSTFWGLKTCCLRIFSAYGPRLKKQLFWDLYNKILRDKNPSLWGTGLESRDFIYIDDIVRVIDLAIKKSSFNSECVNVANGVQIQIKDVVKYVLDSMSVDKIVRFNQEGRIGDPINWEADISIIKQWGYSQTVGLKEGINRYIRWAEENV